MNGYGWKDFEKRKVLGREWKVESGQQYIFYANLGILRSVIVF